MPDRPPAAGEVDPGSPRLQAEHLRRTAPDLARITWQHAGTNLNRLDAVDSWLVPARAARKLRRRVHERRTGHPTLSRNWEVQFGGEQMGRLRDVLLAPDAAIASVVDPAATRRLLDAFAADLHDRELGYTASALLTLHAWLAHR